MAFELPDGGAVTWSSLAAGAGAALILLRKTLSGQSVELANNAAQVNMIATLQAERDAAVKRADEAVAGREAAMERLNTLNLQLVEMKNQIEQLRDEVAQLRGVPKASA